MKIEPFRGYRYAGGPGRDLTPVVAPPYDQIDAETQTRLYGMSPHNIVRLTLPRGEPGRDRYHEARATLDAWLDDGVWVEETRPAIYPYEQTYTMNGELVRRRALIALGELSDYTQGVVLPHERTHHGPKQERMRLLEATRADTGLLFMLVRDSAGRLSRLTVSRDEPIAEARDLRGETHRLWRITDEAAIARAQALMAPEPVIIADGHHRYETAVEYARRHRSATRKLMAFCALEGPGLTILPNHRLVHNVDRFTLGGLAEAARPWFDPTPLAAPEHFTPTRRAIGVVAGDGAMVFRLRDEALERIEWPSGTSPAWRQLAVSILHEGVLRPLLGITDAKLDAKTHVDYTADPTEAVRLVRDGRYQAAFLIAPTTPEELLAVVQGGEQLPQKSTHFYPKLLDGLVFSRLDAT